MKYLSNYPDFKPDFSKVDHLLFDIGYSAGLLLSIRSFLEQLVECGDYPGQADLLLTQINDFQAKRIQLRDEIYDNAEAAAQKGLLEKK